MVKLNKIVFLFFVTSLFLISCNSHLASVPIKPDVEWTYWGDEIIYNATDRELVIELQNSLETLGEIVVPPFETDTLKIPCSDIFQPCIKSCSQIQIYSGDEFLVNFVKGKDDWFENYTYEEFEYTFVHNGILWTEDMLWPRYTYVIKEEDIDIPKEEVTY